MTCAVVLAAGMGRRVGRPKASLRIGAETFLARVVRTCAAAGCEPVVAVVPSAGPFDAAGAIEVVNPRPDDGPLASVRLGLRALPPAPVVLFPVDHPLVLPATVAALARAASRSDGASFARPVSDGKRGHPIALSAAAALALASAPLDGTLRDALSPFAAIDVEVSDPGVLANLNTLEDLRRADLAR